MASGGSKHKMSEEDFDHLCTPCAEDNLTKEAVKYCVQCQRYFCLTCVTAHNGILKRHTLLDNSAGPSAGQQSLPSFPTELCSIHKGKVLDMYCGNHKVVCCSHCVAFDHKSCKDLHSVTDDVDTLYNKTDTDQTKRDMTRILQALDYRRTVTQSLLRQLQDSKTTAIQAVKEYRAEIEEYLAKLEDESIKDIEHEYRKMESELLEERKAYDKVIEELKKLDNSLTKSKGNNPHLFVCTKLAQQKITSTRKEEKRPRMSSVEIVYIPDRTLIQLVQRLPSLGKASVSTISTKEDLYKANLIETIDSSFTNDPSYSMTLGSCILDDIVIFADNNNNKLKRFNASTLKGVDSCQLDDSPNGVCRVGKEEVAVACNTKVQFVSTRDKLVVLRQLKMKHKCYGIAYNNDKLYITNKDKTMYMYDMSGNILKTVHNDKHGQPLFQCCNHIVFSYSGDRMFVGDSIVGLVCFDTNCEYVMTIVDDHARADDVCVDGRGNVFVSGLGSDRIAQFSPGGEKRGVIWCDKYWITFPSSICFHKGLNRLFITTSDSPVQVYQLC